MSVKQHLSERISNAKILKKSTHTEKRARKLYEKMEPILTPLKNLPIRDSGSTEEVFPLDDRDDNRDYIFRKITGPEDVQTLLTSLQDANEEKRWNIENWLSEAIDREYNIVEVRQYGDAEPAGFATYRCYFDTDIHGLYDSKATIHLSVGLETIYVRPSERGNGHSQALSWLIGNHVDKLLHALKNLPEEVRKDFSHLPVEVFVNGEAHSEGGARFLSRTFEQIESNLHFFELRKSWLQPVELTDNIDFSDYPDCGWSDEDDEGYKS